MKTIIVYPSGSHGNFLSAVLNTMTGVQATNLGYMIYDKTSYTQDRNFFSVHRVGLLDPSVVTFYDNIINIYVRPESYLKYASVCLNRTAGVDIQLETLNLNTFEKLNQHVIFSQLLASLMTISGKSSGDVEFKDLREWARLCLFADNGKTITQWITDTQCARADYTFDFEWFYDAATLKEKSTELVTGLGMQVADSIDHLLPDFYNNNRYRIIDQETDKIINAICQGISYNIDNTNCFQEGYIDNWLVDTYQINPLYRNEYFKNTQEIIKQYNLI